MSIITSSIASRILPPVVVQQRRTLIPRRQHVVDRRYFIEIEYNGARDVLSLRASRRHAHGDKLAHETHLPDRERGLFGDFEPVQARHRTDRFDTRHIAGGEDGPPEGGRDCDIADARMRERAADECDILHSRKAKIGDELATTTQQTIVFLAEEARADALFCHSDMLQINRPNGARLRTVPIKRAPAAPARRTPIIL